MNNKFMKRKNPRLKGYNYSLPNAYFITICTHKRENILSTIVGAIHESPKIKLPSQGEIVNNFINNLPQHINAKIDHYVIMPNHIHLIIVVNNGWAIRESPLQSRSVVSKVVGYIKMNSSKEIHKHFGDITVWQRGFHDHIIRNKNDYDKIAKYISENPLRWELDCFFNQ
ncbi:MAG: transposase, partial [Oscillospiraceae bacterium]|nr:transposase [Oscillospiraceae bacterium]